MRRTPTALAALIAGLVLASCGGDDGEPIPSRDASQLEGLLQDVDRQAEAGACNQLTETTLPRLLREARRLPNSVSADTRETIEDGVAHLRDLAEEDCAQDRQDEQDTTATEETTQPETTAPTTTTETTPETTTTEDPTTTEETTTPPETTPPTETVPPDSPGNGNGNGGALPDNPGNGNGGTPPGQEKNANRGKKADGKKGGGK